MKPASKRVFCDQSSVSHSGVKHSSCVITASGNEHAVHHQEHGDVGHSVFVWSLRMLDTHDWQAVRSSGGVVIGVIDQRDQ